MDLKSLSFMNVVVKNNCITLIGSIDLVNKVRDEKWGLDDFVNELIRQLEYFNGIEVNYYELGEDAFIWLQKKIECGSKLKDDIGKFIEEVELLLNCTRVGLGKFLWKEGYFINEKVFCEEVLTPLFRHMKFESVKYNHGVNEFGKDYILSEITKINSTRYYGVQVKAGNIDGGVNSQIDNILCQIKDAFEMPFYLSNINQQHYISELYVIISGKYTLNAKNKIQCKLQRGTYGTVHFLDKENIEDLIVKYWKK